MKLELLGLGFAVTVFASAFALEGSPRREELELPPVAGLDPGAIITDPHVLALAPSLEPVVVGGRTVVSLEPAVGGELGVTSLDVAWQGRSIRTAWNWQFACASDRCLADPELNPACKNLDEQGQQRFDALLAELNQAVCDAQKAFHEELRSCKQRKIDAGNFDLVPRGERIRSDPHASSSSLLVLADGRTRHVQLLPNEFRSLDEVLALRDESRVLRRERVREWIRAQ